MHIYTAYNCTAVRLRPLTNQDLPSNPKCLSVSFRLGRQNARNELGCENVFPRTHEYNLMPRFLPVPRFWFHFWIYYCHSALTPHRVRVGEILQSYFFFHSASSLFSSFVRFLMSDDVYKFLLKRLHGRGCRLSYGLWESLRLCGVSQHSNFVKKNTNSYLPDGFTERLVGWQLRLQPALYDG